MCYIYTMKVATNIYFDQRSTKKDGSHPVKLRVSFEGKKKLYNVIIDKRVLSLQVKEAEIIFGDKPREDNRRLKLKIDAFESSAIDVIEKMDHFSFELFEAEFLGSIKNTPTIESGFNQKIKELKANNKFGTASGYEAALKSFVAFNGDVKYKDITTDWLKKYVLKTKLATTSKGIYLRYLKAVLNGYGKGFVKEYPFNGFSMPISEHRKNEALTKEQISELAKCADSGELNSSEQKAVDFWLFSYNFGGANYADVFDITSKNIDFDHNKITFVRKKTSTTVLEQKAIVIDISERMKSHLNTYGNIKNKYVFDIYRASTKPEKRLLKKKEATKTFNKHTKRVGKRLGFDINLTSTVARHTRASLMNFEGTHYGKIGAMLGHTSIKTTESYLKDFGEKEQIEAQLSTQV